MPLPEEVVKTWEKAGAVVGWMGQNWEGNLDFIAVDPKPKNPIPTFLFTTWVGGKISDRPAAAAPFGLKLITSGLAFI